MKRSVITGATGCIGRNLVDVLLQEGWDVTVLHRRSSDLKRLQDCPVKLKEVNLHDLSSVRAALPEAIDAVFHVAANVSHWSGDAKEQWMDNVLATRNLAEASIERAVGRFVFTSTGATLSYRGCDETSARRIANGYVRTKRLSEIEIEKARSRGLNTVTVQPIIVIGRYDYNNYAQIFTAMKNGPIRACFPGRMVFCHAQDVARAHLQAFEKGKAGDSYLLHGEYATWREVFGLICRHLGVSPPIVIPRPVLMAASHAMSLGSHFTAKRPLLTPELVRLLKDSADLPEPEKRKTESELGYRSRSLEAMVADCHDWLVREKLI